MTNHNENSNSDSSVPNHYYSKPFGNRIEFKKTDFGLTVCIHPLQNTIKKSDTKALNVINGCLGIVMIIFIPALILMNILMVFIVVSLIYLIVSQLSIPALLILVLVGLSPLRFTLETDYIIISQSSKFKLLINERTFVYDWSFLGLNYHVTGKTKDLSSVKVVEFNTLKKVGYQGYLCLNQGIRSHKFGLGLFRYEQEWLAQEINAFLEKLRSNHQ
ncbi:hypothetical protein [Calothrix sp. 336/3]|uniref:hypothetical protein n=1 Tax=Calothrix sp. 336/3 TaxID=1337936 RepID=UPI0004E31754|nr:hypothetical protein [Calothrix sp. 336/3]AKG21557.1 hypothetical protein IJ00_09970 [Calothrix sp. 336/3]